MIEVITPGIKKFYCHCSNCNCYFSYGLEDLSFDNNIYCPECSEKNDHQSFTNRQIELSDRRETASPSYLRDSIKLY